MNIPSPPPPGVRPAAHRHPSEVGLGHLCPIAPLGIQHVPALHVLSPRGGGGHGKCASANTHRRHSVRKKPELTRPPLYNAGAPGVRRAALGETVLPVVLQRFQGPGHYHMWGESPASLCRLYDNNNSGCLDPNLIFQWWAVADPKFFLFFFTWSNLFSCLDWVKSIGLRLFSWSIKKINWIVSFNHQSMLWFSSPFCLSYKLKKWAHCMKHTNEKKKNHNVKLCLYINLFSKCIWSLVMTSRCSINIM